MTSIVATAQPDKGRVRIDLDWTSLFGSGVTVPKCWVYRYTLDQYATPTLIREGNPCILSNLKATIYDVEAPLDTPVYYQAVTALNPNGDFESTVEGWTGSPLGLSTGGTATQSTDYFYAGNASLQWTPNGTTASNKVLSDPFFAVVGTSYTVNAQVLATKTWTGGVGLIIQWFTGGGVFISESGTASNLWPAVGVWEAYTLTATAPATAVFGRIGLLITNTPPTTAVFYLDEAYVYTAASTIDTSTGLVTLNANPYFEPPLNATGWAGVNNAAVAADALFAHQLSQSLLITPDGVTAVPQAQSDEIAVTAGTSYTLGGWIRSTLGGDTLTLNIFWFNSSHTFLSSSVISAAPTAATWTQYGPTAFTAPAGAAFARIVTNNPGTPAASHTWRLDEAVLQVVSPIPAITLSSTQGGWWKDPLHPATMVRLQDSLSWASCGMRGVALVGVSRPTRPADAAVLDVPNQSIGVGSFAPRKAAQRTVGVAVCTFPDADAIRDLHASGAPLLLQLPARMGVPEHYGMYGNLTFAALGPDMNRPFQLVQVDETNTQNPPGPAEGVLGVRYQDLRVKSAKLTYTAATAAGYTWLDALKGNIS